MMPLMKLLDDPLLAARLVSVGAGAITMVGLFLLGSEIFKNKRIGALSAFLYAIYPFGLVYDRMALYDSLVGTFAVWGIYILILLVRRVRLDLAFFLGIIAGSGTLNKTSGFSTIYFLPLSLLLFDWKEKNRWHRLFRWVLFALFATGLTYLYYSILRLSPFFHIIDEKNTTFIFPIHEWLQHPFLLLVPNFTGLFSMDNRLYDNSLASTYCRCIY